MKGKSVFPSYISVSMTESSNSTVHSYFLKEEWKVKVEDSEQLNNTAYCYTGAIGIRRGNSSVGNFLLYDGVVYFVILILRVQSATTGPLPESTPTENCKFLPSFSVRRGLKKLKKLLLINL